MKNWKIFAFVYKNFYLYFFVLNSPLPPNHDEYDTPKELAHFCILVSQKPYSHRFLQ